jgi:1-acyl-sn-glycerol-3-phosphate acyltransferase
MIEPDSLPKVAKRQLRWFAQYLNWFLRRNFHGLHLLRLTELEQLTGLPLLLCLNHPSWWDPLIGLHLSQRFFPNRHHAAPIAEVGLAKYKFFERLGFFGIEANSFAGSMRFLEIGRAVLSRCDGAFWATPQGAFTDVRQPVLLEPGAGHLARHAKEFAMLPVALEYSFWSERYPEAFACFGRPIIGCGIDRSATQWNELFTCSLQATLDALSARIQMRNASAFEPLLEGNAGVGGVYDVWRGVKARLRGKNWQPEHGGN